MSKADNKLSGARNLGILGAVLLGQTDKFKPKDLETLYRFGLDKSSRFDLALSGLAKKTNADVELYRFKNPEDQVLGLMGNVDFRLVSSATRNANLQLLATSKRRGNRNENLATNLDSGEYVVRVLGRSGKSRYSLQVAATATAIAPSIVTPPIKEKTEEKLVDIAAPTAILSAANLSNAGGNTYDFTITYDDNSAINIASLDGSPDKSDIQVTGPNGFSQGATFVSVNDPSNGTPRVATYRITAPGGTWDDADNGSYAIALQGNQVSDTSGNFASAASLGSFLANMPLPRRVLQASGGSNGSVDGFSLTINTKVKPQGNVFPQALENFQFKSLLAGGRNQVASDINLGSASITSSLFTSGSESGVEYTATFADYSGNLLDSSSFTLSSNRLVFQVVTSDPSAASSLVPLENLLLNSDPGFKYILFFAVPSGVNASSQEIPGSSLLLTTTSTVAP